MNKFKKGFTLIELLVVVGIIGILSTVVLVSINSGTAKAKRASALKTMRSAMGELVSCADSGGFARTNLTNPIICASTLNGATAKTGHSANWPTLSNGWSYVAPTGALANSSYVYTATSSATGETITCTFLTNKCS